MADEMLNWSMVWGYIYNDFIANLFLNWCLTFLTFLYIIVSLKLVLRNLGRMMGYHSRNPPVRKEGLNF